MCWITETRHSFNSLVNQGSFYKIFIIIRYAAVYPNKLKTKFDKTNEKNVIKKFSVGYRCGSKIDYLALPSGR